MTPILVAVLFSVLPDAMPDCLPDAKSSVIVAPLPDVKPTPKPKPAPKPKGPGHWENRCGPNGCQQVWVADEPAARTEPNPETQTYSRRRWFRR